MCCCALHVRMYRIILKCTLVLCRGEFLPSFSTGAVVGWLELGTDWVHFTRSAQLGPVWQSRAAASVGRGPLNKKHTHHAWEQTNMNLTIRISLSAGLIFNYITLYSLSKRLQQSEDSFYPTPQLSPLWDSMWLYWTKGLRYDQYPFPAASNYRAVHILNRCFSSL